MSHLSASSSLISECDPATRIRRSSSITSRDLRFKTLLCPEYSDGICTHGDTCCFAHSLSEVRKLEIPYQLTSRFSYYDGINLPMACDIQHILLWADWQRNHQPFLAVPQWVYDLAWDFHLKPFLQGQRNQLQRMPMEVESVSQEMGISNIKHHGIDHKTNGLIVCEDGNELQHDMQKEQVSVPSFSCAILVRDSQEDDTPSESDEESEDFCKLDCMSSGRKHGLPYCRVAPCIRAKHHAGECYCGPYSDHDSSS
jgi:hypothetical protein